MSETPVHPVVCIYCRQPIDKSRDDYVVINKDQDQYDTAGFVAHRRCHERSTSPSDTPRP